MIRKLCILINEKHGILEEIGIDYTLCNPERVKMVMTEHQWKEFSKWCLDNGQRKLTKGEKEAIKLAIDQTESLNELVQVVFTSLAIDSNRY